MDYTTGIMDYDFGNGPVYPRASAAYVNWRHQCSIDPATCAIRLSDADNRPLPFNLLSAGERQLLATSILWGLAKVSRRPVPLVIDTPLGMTSGTIRRALLENTLMNSQQIVLFLTRDEIKGVEDILDKHATVNYTMTNTQHAIHAVDPSFAEGRPMEIILCRCKHDTSCKICARKED